MYQKSTTNRCGAQLYHQAPAQAITDAAPSTFISSSNCSWFHTKQCQISMSLPVLCDATVTGIVDVYDFITGPTGHELVKKVSLKFYFLQFIYQAWERCTTKEWNFSGKCLMSKKEQAAP